MDYRRARVGGGRYFFTVVTWQRRPILLDHIGALRRAFRTVARHYPFHIDAMVVLPDHLHALWRLPEGDSNFSMRWSLIKRSFSSSLRSGTAGSSPTGRRERALWQRRFWEHLIRDEADWRRHMDYIHYNPVKHGVARSPAQWPYSSFERCVARGWYSPQWGAAEPPEIQGMWHE